MTFTPRRVAFFSLCANIASTTSGAKPCSFSGSTVNQSSPVGQLLMGARGDLQKVAGLPGAQDDGQQVKVETTDKINRVTVTLCWQGPNDGDKRNYQIQAFVH